MGKKFLSGALVTLYLTVGYAVTDIVKNYPGTESGAVSISFEKEEKEKTITYAYITRKDLEYGVIFSNNELDEETQKEMGVRGMIAIPTSYYYMKDSDGNFCITDEVSVEGLTFVGPCTNDRMFVGYGKENEANVSAYPGLLTLKEVQEYGIKNPQIFNNATLSEAETDSLDSKNYGVIQQQIQDTLEEMTTSLISVEQNIREKSL